MFRRIALFIGWLFGGDDPQLPPPPTNDNPPAPPPPVLLPERESFAYGKDPLQTADVYRPPGTVLGSLLRVIFLVHGSGWQSDKSDKANAGVVDAKVAHYLPLWYMVISIDYRLWTKDNGITPLQEAQDVADALAYVQQHVAGVDPARVTLVGHSAGGHLVALATASESIRKYAGCRMPEKVVCLDAIYDVQDQIDAANATGNAQMMALYRPFGTDRTAWPAESPIEQVSGPLPPFCLAYSTQEGAWRKKQATNFAMRIAQFGGPAPAVQGFDLSHGEMGSMLGEPCPLTTFVDGFLG